VGKAVSVCVGEDVTAAVGVNVSVGDDVEDGKKSSAVVTITGGVKREEEEALYTAPTTIRLTILVATRAALNALFRVNRKQDFFSLRMGPRYSSSAGI
jgi:hypothetical protein